MLKWSILRFLIGLNRRKVDTTLPFLSLFFPPPDNFVWWRSMCRFFTLDFLSRWCSSRFHPVVIQHACEHYTNPPPPKDKWKGWMAIEIERKHDDWRFIQPSAHQAVCYVNSSRLTHSPFFFFLFDITNNLVVPAVLCDVANMASSNGAIRKRVADARMWITRPWGLLW